MQFRPPVEEGPEHALPSEEAVFLQETPVNKVLAIMVDDSHPLHTVISTQRSLFSNRLLLPGVNPAECLCAISVLQSLCIVVIIVFITYYYKPTHTVLHCYWNLNYIDGPCPRDQQHSAYSNLN